MIPDRDGDSDSGMTFLISGISLSHTPKLGVELKFEIRCYIRDPDGYIIEIGQSTTLTYG